MDDDNIILEPQIDGSTPKDSMTDSGNTSSTKNDDADDLTTKSEQVFEITPDLNISPIDPDKAVEPAPEPQPIIPIPKKAIPSQETPSLKVYSMTAAPDTKGSVVHAYAKPTTEAPMMATKQNFPLSTRETPTTTTNSIPAAPITPTPRTFVPEEALQKSSAYSYIPQAEKTVPGISSIRTYESDVAQVITEKGTSTTEMVIAENKKETGEEAVIVHKDSTNSGRKSLLAILSLILIGAGIIGAYYLYSISPLAPSKTPVIQQTAAPVSLIPSDSQITLAVDGLTTNAVLTKLRALISSPKPAGTIQEIIPYVTVKNIKTRVTANEMVALMDIPAPNMLTRSLTANWMLGTYTDKQNKTSTFVVITNNFFQNAFAGMLSWESVISDDLKLYLYPTSVMGIANTPTTLISNPLQNIDSILPASMVSTSTATSTATSATTTTTTKKIASTTPKTTPKTVVKNVISTSTRSLASTTSTSTSSSTIDTITPLTPYTTIKGKFVDKIIKNKDVREFVSSDGNIIFLYSFIDNAKLVITSNEATLTEIIARLEKGAFMR